MPKPTFLTSEIAIGDLTNKISIDSDGNMTFVDPYIGPVKLKDLINGGTIITNPAMIVSISETDTVWQQLPANQFNQNFFKFRINLDWTVDEEAKTDISILDENNNLMTVESVKFFTNYVEIITSKKLNMKVALKQIG